VKTDAEAFTQDPTLPHYHQCGRLAGGLLPDFGCRHVWQHAAEPTKNYVKYSTQHKCPLCGKGPWYYVLSEEEFESAHSETR